MQSSDRIEVLLGVEIGRLTLGVQRQSVDRVAAIDSARRRLHVGAARANREVLERAVRAVETNRVAVEIVVIADDEAIVVQTTGREIERRPLSASRGGNIVIPDATRL